MVRETRHLWVGNLPENIREDRIREQFKRYGRVQSVKLLPGVTKEETGEITMACTVAFMDIKSASKAHNSELKIDDRTLNTEYYEPAAIPSAASPQNTPSPYATSPAATRFPNGHGSSDEHTPFADRFYDRTVSRTTAPEGEYIRRQGYHDTARGRNRDRSYRNGPYNPLVDRHRSGPWSYSGGETARYAAATAGQTDTGYAPEGVDRKTTAASTATDQKKKKSRSRTRSPSPSGSTSSRSPSRSRSRSTDTTRSTDGGTTSRETSPASSSKSKTQQHKQQQQQDQDQPSANSSGTTPSALTSGNPQQQQVLLLSEDKRPLAICVKKLPLRSSDSSLKDGLFHEYKKHGKVSWVRMYGINEDRFGLVLFKKPEDAEKAVEISYDKLFFGAKIEVEYYMGYYPIDANDVRPFEVEVDEFHPKATRTLFVGNLEKDVTQMDLRKHFDQFGEIIEIDIKKQGVVSSYAFCQYSDITSVVKAIRKMDGEHLGNNRIKLGFGKSMPTNCVWVDGVGDNVSDKYLKMHFDPFGVIAKVHVDRERGQALVFYEQVSMAQTAVTKMRGFTLKSQRIQVDFASRECQEAFFEHLEKQGQVLDRSVFDERRDSTSRGFDATTNRFSRYDTPTRPRTSSYSSRSSATASQITSALPSPGTPGSVTPRGTGSSRSRTARFAEYYDQTSAEYADRHFRSYDEYSQGSPASHDDVYDHEYTYMQSPLSIDHLEPKSLDSSVPFPPPDMRNLQKERVHLLEQLEECPSSGDELISPKKRVKLDLLDGAVTSDVIIEANRDHRKVMEVRRLSDANLKHHSRRPSIDSGKHIRGEMGHNYLPHAVCKRRKTGGSDSSSRVHNYDHSGSESIGGSRPGTPLCDERPENFQPTEPRRIPREREGPLSLPLPRFAAQVMNRGSVSVAGIKGQKDNVLSSPPPAVTSPRISNPRPPSPVHVPPPASPPPRPPSLSSNSSDSDAAPPSPSLEERIRSLDEKYEKWSGSRALSAAGGDALATLDANLEKFRLRHKILDLDLKEVQPSEIVKSVMAKRSVFDEDSKRLENVGEKYEPKDFSCFPRASALCNQTIVPVTQQQMVPVSTTTTPSTVVLKLAPVPQLPKTPTMLSPRSSGTTTISAAAKGLQYPFPSHPPPLQPVPLLPSTPTSTTAGVASLPSTSTSTTGSSAATTTTTTTVSVTRVSGAPHGDSRLKSCATSDSRTSSKSLSVNRCGGATTTTTTKTSNIPLSAGDKVQCVADAAAAATTTTTKSRRNSDANSGSGSDVSNNQKEQRLEKARLENERLEKEKQEKERIERERLEKEKQEKERQEKERLEKERLERESELEKERLQKERIEKERLEKEKQEKERQERERLEKERLEAERKEKEERERKEREEQLERERRDRERKERLEREERERKEHERQEKERRELEERERKEREEKEEQAEKEKHEKERSRHKDDNHHDKKKDEHRHRENHSESKHLYEKNTKEDKNHENCKKDYHDSRSSHEKSRHHVIRDDDRRKESIKENRDNNIHDKHKNFSNDIKEKPLLESRHMSLDMDKSKTYEIALFGKDPIKRKERNNSLPASLGNKRRMSSHDSLDIGDEAKRIKLSQDHKKLSERRDSKDSTRSEERIKSKHKNNSINKHDKHNNTKDSEEKQRKEKEREERHKKHKLEKQKLKSKSREKESRESPNSLPKSPLSNKDFLAKLDLRSTEEMESIDKQRRDKEKRKEAEEDKREKEEKTKSEDRSKKEKMQSFTLNKENSEKSKQPREDPSTPKSADERKAQRKEQRIRKITNSSDNTDSDEPKKHSIFDIVDDEPAYISMYDKVKARSCKNMQKQEEEKRQEKIKAKFSQLKQSRAKREEKKRSTSWDEDSDSDRERIEGKPDFKLKRSSKMCIVSSDDDEPHIKNHKKKELYTDSDSDRPKPIKTEFIETSDDDRMVVKNSSHFKACKSRITSDTSDDDFKKTKVKTEIFSDNDQGFADFYVKKEMERLIKKERRNSKHQDMNDSQLFESNSTVAETKEKINRMSFPENTTDDEVTNEVKKDRSDRKKHKKKQKKQKHLFSSDESSKLDNAEGTQNSESMEKSSKHHDKKKQHSKKDKKRDKSKDERDKSKKSKKNKSESKAESKTGQKVENLFGSLSEDSENGIKEQKPNIDQPKNSFHNKFNDDSLPYNNSDSEQESKIKLQEEKEREREEHKRRKEKKRKEKERRMQEAAQSNDNSMDFADMCKQLEANIKDESVDNMDDIVAKKELPLTPTIDDDSYNGTSEVKELSKEERKEAKEKKKKRKKSKEEKQQKHHHHHHHHDKNKVKSPEFKREPPEFKKEVEVKEEPELFKKESTPTPEIKIEIEEPKTQNMPNINEYSPDNSKSSPSTLDYSISPNISTALLSPIPKTPTTSKDKKREKLIPAFGADIDENLHESAIKSISEFEPVKQESPVKEEPKVEKPAESPEEKPRVVISQEETEDAVAALLGESFGGEQPCYTEEITTTSEPASNLTEESNVQDDEEMRQAVQSLSAADLDAKPDTPQSEHDLQIDTDTEEPEEVRFDQLPKTPDMNELLHPPKTPDMPSYFRNAEPTKINSVSHMVLKSANIGSPPSLTPIKPMPAKIQEVAKKLDHEPSKSLPLLPEQEKPVVNNPLKAENKVEPPQPPVIVSQAQAKQVAVTTASPRSYTTPPIVKITEPTYPPLTAISKPEPKPSPNIEQLKKLQVIPVLPAVQQKSPTLHNLPARSPVQMKSIPDSGLLSPKGNLSRLPITSVVVSKPLQPNTIILPQAKVAHALEPPKLVSASDVRPQERPKMVFQNATIQPSQYHPSYMQTPPRMVVQSNIRGISPQGLLVPTSRPYGYMNNTVNAYNLQPVPTNMKENMIEKPQPEPAKVPQIVTTSQTSMFVPTTTANNSSINSVKSFMNVIQETPQPKVQEKPVEVQKPPPVAAAVAVTPENHLKVQEISKTSTPSPVIVATPKEIVPEPTPVVVAEVKQESVEEAPLKLAIEAVTEELNLSLEKEVVEIKEETPPIVEETSKQELPTPIEAKKEEVKETILEAVEEKSKPEPENVSVIKEIEKFDEEKAETESIISDISKERSSADMLSKDDPLDSKEDSDYWSAKEVNIESVLKTLCSGDDLSDQSSAGKDDWYDKPTNESIKSDTSEKDVSIDKKDTTLLNESKSEEDTVDEGVENEEKETPVKVARGRGGRRGRGRGRGSSVERGGIQTRRGKLKEAVNTAAAAMAAATPVPTITTTAAVAKRGGRGGRAKNERKVHKSESDSSLTDVYEFRDDADESTSKERPRLILTIKSPAIAAGGNTQTAVVKEVLKDGHKEIVKEMYKEAKPPSPSPPPQPQQENNKEQEFVSPTSNSTTRKSKRLQERDVSKNSVDDTIEDVVKNTIQTRAAAASQNLARRSPRQAGVKAPLPESPKKPVRVGRLPKKDRRGSETNEDSDVEKPKEEIKVASPEPVVKEAEKLKELEKEESKAPEPQKEVAHGLKAAMMRKLKGEQNHEPTNLIDPVTGLLIPMRECEEGKYIPLPGSAEQRNLSQPQICVRKLPVEMKQQPTVITQPQPQQVTVVQQPKPQSFKAHVLASQAAKAVVSQQTPPVCPVPVQNLQPQPAIVVSKGGQQPLVINKVTQPLVVTKVTQPVVVTKSLPQQPILVNKASVHQTVTTPKPTVVVSKSPNLNQGLNVNVSMAANMTPSHLSPKVKVMPPQMSPSQMAQLSTQQLLQVAKQHVPLSKAHLVNAMSQAQIVNSQIAHAKSPQLMKQQVIITKGKPQVLPMHQQPIAANAVPSPPLLKTQQQISGATRVLKSPAQQVVAGKGQMDPPKADPNMSKVILGTRGTLSPQGQQTRHIFDANMGDNIPHFPPGTVQIRSFQELPAYLHPHAAMQYHPQFLRQQNYHLPRSPMMPGNLEKLDGQEGEEAPVTSPPLELRRAASVGLALTGRGAAVPHSLHSPRDRATDSPQVAQVYMHASRVQHYHASHPNRYYDEPPPAHRQMTSHTLAALSNDRPMRITPMGNAERPHSGHLPPERPLSGHSALAGHIDRPVSGHGLIMPGLGAPSNLLTGRHIGAEAPASQRGLQASTPPYASQVPPHVENLALIIEDPNIDDFWIKTRIIGPKEQHPCVWQGQLALKNDSAAVRMYFVSGNDEVAKCCLPQKPDEPLRIFQRMRLEQPQLDGVNRKMQMPNEHVMLLALPYGCHYHEIIKQSNNLTNGFITYLQQKQAAGIINLAAPGTTQPPAYVVHVFPSCDYVTENLRRIAPHLMENISELTYLLIVITTV